MDAHQAALNELDKIITTIQDYHCDLEMGEDFEPKYVLDLTTQAGLLVSGMRDAVTTDPLALAQRSMEWKEAWREKVGDAADQELADHYKEMEDVCRADAIAYAAIAQAQAAQPRLIRIDGRVINLAHVTDVDFKWKDYEGKPVLRILLDVYGGEGGAREVWYSGDLYEPVAAFLRSVLQPHIVAEIDLPAKQYASQLPTD